MVVTVEAIRSGRNWEIVAVVRSNRNEVADFLDALPVSAQKKIVRMFRIIADAEDGPFMFRNEQKMRHLTEDLYEMKSGSGAVAVLHRSAAAHRRGDGFPEEDIEDAQGRDRARTDSTGAVLRGGTVTDSIDRLRARFDEWENDAESELYAVLLDVTEGIVKRMIEQGVRRTDLAERLGTSRAYVTKLLDGQENMTLKTLVRVANALEMKVDTRFVPRERAAKAPKRPQMKTAVGWRMRGGSPVKPLAKAHVVVASQR